MGKKRDEHTGELFIEEGGQLRLTDKSAEQRSLEDERVTCLGRTFPDDDARREYFLEKLAEKLKDPEFRKAPGFPKGSDEDILRLSDPPYYTACPNPFFRMAGDSTREDAQKIVREPYCFDVSEGKTASEYLAHSYHTKVPPRAITRYLLWYTRPGDVVLDSYCGSGMTAVAARMCDQPPTEVRHSATIEWQERSGGEPRWGKRRVVLSDLSPAASFVAANYSKAQPVDRVVSEVTMALSEAEAKFSWMYETSHVGWPAGERKRERWRNRESPEGTGKTILVVWTEVFSCPNCGGEFNLWVDGVDPSRAAVADPIVCPDCSAETTKTKLERRHDTVWDPLLGTSRVVNKFIPALIVYEFEGRRFEKHPDQKDLEIIEKSDRIAAVGSPIRAMMDSDGQWGAMHRAGYHQGITHVHHFFTNRNWVIFNDIWTNVRSNAARFVLTSLLARLSRMHAIHLKNFFRGGGGFAAGNRKGQLYIPSLSLEISPFDYLPARAVAATKAFEGPTDQPAYVGTCSARALDLEDNAVDYVFVDPPFGQNLVYSELNFLWEAWLRVFTDTSEETIVDSFRSKHVRDYQLGMRDGFRELFRVLKPGGWMTVVFHNSKNEIWIAIQEALQQAGFTVADVRVLDKRQASQKQAVAPGTVKSDLAISAYKPDVGFESKFMLAAGTEEGVWEFVRQHMNHLPVYVGSRHACEILPERQGYLLFDRTVAYHVQKGITVPMSAAEFYSGLSRMFPERDGMFFLSTQVNEYDQRRRFAEELQQLALFVTDEASAVQWLRQRLQVKPQTFSELQPAFMREQAWAKHERTIELQLILEQNFLCYDGNGPVPSQIHSYLSTNFKDMRNLDKEDPILVSKAVDRWYVPDTSKQGDLEKTREKQLLREFEEYRTTSKRRLKLFRTEAVRIGFKAAYDRQDYRTIIDVARKLPDTVLQEDEKLLMYYDVAAMRLGEDA